MNLSTLERTKYRIGIAILSVAIFLLRPLCSFAQPTYFGSSSTPADPGAAIGPTPAAVVPPAGMQAGDLVIMYGEYRAVGIAISINQAGGQTWNTATTYSPGSNQGIAIFWCTFNGTWSANPSIRVPAGNVQALSTIMYVYRPSNPNSSWGVNFVGANANSGTNPNTITGVPTTLSNTVTMAFWSSAAANTWGTLAGASWSKTGLSAQYRNTSTSGQSHTAAYRLMSAAGATGNVSQTQSATTTALKSIVAWNELNDNCNAATLLTQSATCSNIAGTLLYAASTAGVPGSCGNASSADVWYQFVATTSFPVITLSSVGANFSTAGPRIQLLSGSCGSWTSLACASATSMNTYTAIGGTGLTIGNTYYVRIATNTNTGILTSGTYGFNICITEPNDLCTNAITLTSNTSCSNITGNMYGSTLTAPTITAPDCATGVTNDVWYRFVAQTTNPTITLSNIGANFAPNVGMQLLSNNCGGTFTSYFCGTTSIAANYLTPGTTYFVRVYSTSGSAPVSSAGWEFDICITDPTTQPPSNDDCSGAINLPVFNSCSTNPGNMAGSTPSAVPLGGACTGPNAYDVWYRFVAANTTATVTISSLGANFTNSGIEILSGSCGSLASIACATGLTVNAAGLTTGNTYFVRVYSRTAPPPNGNSRFNICVTTTGLPVRFGNSYVNISKRTTGGVVEPGDTLEIRMTINHTSGTFYNLRYVDNVPTNTAMLTGATDRIRVITNEGLFYKQYTLAAGDDAATYIASPPASQYNIRMNLAFGASLPGTPANNTATEFLSADGQMVAGSDRPRGGGGMLFATAFRVVVTGNVGDTVTLNAGQFIYRTALDGGTEVTLTATPFKMLINEPLDLCANSIGVNNAAELGGTFGSGTTLTRGFDLTTPISGYTFINEVNAYNQVGDGRYSIVKNMSLRSGTERNARRVPNCNVPSALAWDDQFNCNNRMFGGHWDIDGDHTGTTNSIGNLPPAAPTNSGYMLMVNADYVASEIFRQNINNLCPNTYYEFSAWIRNICKTCGADSTGAQFAGTATAPANGYPGVYPNLSFALNDVDYYNSGQVDTVGWLKKGFVFRTGPAQTSAVFSIRNNSQGGGGNDWVLDDIAVATCLPTMSYSPTINPNVCEANSILIADTISSYFDNYTTYKWQRSVNGGASWADITGVTTLPDTNYYITTYTVPPSATNLADSGDLYRVVVATTAANLTDLNCNISDGVTITLSVLDCGPVLDVDLLSFNGKLIDSKSQLSWSTSQEEGPVTYLIERSTDGRNFSSAGQVTGYNNGNATNHYTFTDPVSVADKVWYRVIIMNGSGKQKHSSIIQLKNDLRDFELNNIVNPFNSSLQFDIAVTTSSAITAELIDFSGKSVLTHKQLVYAGTNSITLTNTASLPSGIYTLRVLNKDRFIIKRVMKKN